MRPEMAHVHRCSLEMSTWLEDDIRIYRPARVTSPARSEQGGHVLLVVVLLEDVARPEGELAPPPPPSHGVPIRSGMPRHGRSGSRERRRASHLGSVHDSSRETNACFQIGRGDGVPTVTSYPGQVACHCAPRHTSSASCGGEVEATVLGASGNGGAVPFREEDRRGFRRWRR
jgi:hypothetical protein